MMAGRLALIATCFGCGASTPKAGGDVHASCAASYASVGTGQACEPVGLSCPYPEGRCFCGPESYCGGEAPTPEMKAELARPHWQCEAIRTDGCPAEQPAGACTTDGQTCTYGDCCKTPIRCTDGAWVSGQTACPP